MGLTIRICDHQNTEEELVVERDSGDSGNGNGRVAGSKSGPAPSGGYTADELRLLADELRTTGAAVSPEQSFAGPLFVVVVLVVLLVVAVGVMRAPSKKAKRRTGFKAGGEFGAARKRR
jgi:hypothetical protein